MSVTLTCASTTIAAGGSISLAVTIASTLPLACTDIQFTLSYTSDLTLTGVANGAASIAASKTLSRAGNLCIIASVGINNNVIGDGVLATLAFNVSATPASTSVSVNFTGVVASDVNADAISVSTVAGLVTITQVTPPTPPPSCVDVPVNAYTPPFLLLNEPVEQVGT